MHVRFFFRKASADFHSIEKLFDAVIQELPDKMASVRYAPFPSKGLINRLRIGFDARKQQIGINHITGDIHFIAMFLEKSRTVLTIHDLGVLKSGNLFKRMILRLFWYYLPIKSAARITVVSEFTKNELIKQFKINPEKVWVIPNCYPAIYKADIQKYTNEKPVILQIGTKANKNLERLIKALKGIECTLQIVGKLSENQLHLLKNEGIDYENHHHISEEKMLELFKNCDLLAYISTYEGFGMPVIEANAVGKPVLASDIEPIRTVASNAAWLVNPFVVDEIRQGILKLLNDKALCENLIQNGLENAKKYHPSVIVTKYLEVYQSLKN